MHLDSGRCGHIHTNLGGIVEPHFVFDNLGVQASLAKLFCHVFGGGFVLGRSGDVRGFGQNAEMLFRELGIGHGQEFLFDLALAGDIAEAADGPVLRLGFFVVIVIFLAGLIKRQQTRTNQREEQHCTGEKFHEALGDTNSETKIVSCGVSRRLNGLH